MKSVISQYFRNMFTSTSNLMVSIIISFFFTPYLISMLGKEQYGLWTLVFSLLAYIRLADAGMQQSLVRFVSKFFATKQWDKLNQVISSSAYLYTYVASATLLAGVVIALFFVEYLKIPPESVMTAKIVLLILAANQAVYFITMPFCALGAFHRFDIVNYFIIGNNIVQTLGIIFLLENGLGLVEMAALILVLNIIGIAWRTRIRMNLFPEAKFSRSLIDKTTAKQLINYGVYSFLIVIAWTVIYQTDNIVIGAFISTEAITLYSVAAMIVIQLRTSITSIAIPLVSTISHYEALQDYAKIMDIYSRSMRYLYYISAFLCIIMFFFGGPFILLWVKKDFMDSIIILKILMFGAVFSFPHNITNSVLYGISKHRIAFFILGAEALANIILSVILVHSRGIVGVALGTAIPQLIIYIFIFPVVFYRTMGAKVKDFYATAAASSLKAILLLLPSSYIIYELIDPGSWPTLILDCTVVTIIMAVGFWVFILEKDIRMLVISKIKARLGRA